MIPYECFTSGNSALLEFSVWQNGKRVTYEYYWEQFPRPILISNFKANDKFNVQVTYKWKGSPLTDYTVKVYSSLPGLRITNRAGITSQIYMDGSTPSGF
jgi:hypothetical protein